MCVEYSGTGAVIIAPLRVARRNDNEHRLARLRQPGSANIWGAQDHNNSSNAGIDFDQSAALTALLHLDCSVPAWHTEARRRWPCCPSSRLSSLSLPSSSPRLTELMQLILVPSVTSTAT